MTNDLPLLFERVRALLDARSDSAELDLAKMEHTLTDGYARALELEAERARVEREIGELARQIDDPVHLGHLRDLSERRSSTDDELARLRALLELLRQRVDERRAVASS